MSERRLKIRMSGVHAADLEQEPRTGRLRITYVKSWLDRPDRALLSVRMPFREKPFEDETASPFIAGLLPDSKVHRKMIGDMLGVTAENDFSLLAEIGRECAGAVSIVHWNEPDEPETSVLPSFERLDEATTAQLVRDLPRRPLLLDGDEIRLSLAGVHDKAAVIQVDGGVALPKGGTPSTHILKIDIPGLDDSIRTEHFCLRLADAAGVKTPRSKIVVAEDQVFMLIARYDRKMVASNEGTKLVRLHQEDLAQALGYAPEMKYERDGGPSWKQVFDIVGRETQDPSARLRLLNAALFQWFIDNPDAHAKNYSLLYKGNGKIDLAPMYDLNNAAVHKHHFKAVRPRMAMSVGGVFDPGAVTGADWDRFAKDIGMPASVVRGKIKAMARELPDLAAKLESDYRDTPAWSPKLEGIVYDVAKRCAGVEAMLDRKAVRVVEDDLRIEQNMFSI